MVASVLQSRVFRYLKSCVVDWRLAFCHCLRACLRSRWFLLGVQWLRFGLQTLAWQVELWFSVETCGEALSKLLANINIACRLRRGFRLGGLRVVIENFTGWNVDAYDHPAWFLLPYCLLCLSAPLIFGVMDRVGIWRALGVSLALSVLSMYVISRYIAPAKAHHEWYAILFTYFDLLFSFVLGALVCYRNMRSSWTIEWLHGRQWLVRALFLAWFGLHLLTGSALWDVLFLCLFMLLFLNLEIRGRVRRTLLELGSKSMTMWLVHAFVYGTFFHDQIYGLRFPPLIFLGLVFASYVLSIPIMWLARVSIGRIGWLATK